MKKDAIILCQFFYPEKIAMLPFQTAISMVEEGIEVDVMCGYPKEYIDGSEKIKKTEIIKGVNIKRKKYLQLSRIGKISRLINYFSFTAVVFFNLFKFHKYKTIIVYSNPPIIPIIAVLANMIFGTKIIFVAYDLYPEIAEKMNVLKENSLISKVMSKINSLLYKRATAIIALSPEMKEFIMENRGIESEKVTIIPNWSTDEQSERDTRIMTPEFEDIRKKYKIIVSYFGNMGIAQDMETIKEVISNSRLKNSEIGFLFAGHGNKKQELEKFITDKGLNNCYVYGYLSGDEFSDAREITDINIISLAKGLAGLAVPSKTYGYYKSGKPVIAIMDKATEVFKEIADNKCGLSVENGKSNQVVEWLLEVVDNQEVVLEMRNNVKKLHDEYYDKKKTLKKYTKLIKEVILEEKTHV